MEKWIPVKFPEAHTDEKLNKKSSYYFSRLPNRCNRYRQLLVHTFNFANSHFQSKDSLNQKVEENYTPRV